MAKIIPSPSADASISDDSRHGRHLRLASQEDLILVREVSAANAHLAPFGEKRKRFEEVAEKANDHTSLCQKVIWRVRKTATSGFKISSIRKTMRTIAYPE